MLASEGLELPEGVYRTLLSLHRGHVMVQHMGSWPPRDRLDVLPGDVLPDRVGRKGPAEDMASVLQVYLCPFRQAPQVLPNAVVG